MSDLIDRKAAIDTLSQYPFEKVVNCISIIEELPPAEPEQQWISCSDAPGTNRNVFIARGEQGNMTVCIGHYSHDYKRWYEDRDWFAMPLYDGLYWCEIPPLPKPYEERREE